VAKETKNNNEALWALIQEIMKKLFAELNWDGLAAMQHKQRIGAVKK
jgi:hypothetical protein